MAAVRETSVGHDVKAGSLTTNVTLPLQVE